MIVKPISGSLGSGIYKLSQKDTADEKKREEILKRIFEEKALVEECIRGCDELQRFHPQSLNTIRVVTVTDGETPRVFGSFFRMGVGGSVVDNAHAGGIFAHVDIKNGIIDTHAMNTDGKKFEYHPDSKLPIKGFSIPKWEEITKTCIAAHRLCDNFIVGWDVTVNSAGEVDFIEGNHAPDMDLMQGPTKHGMRAEFESAFRAFRNKRK